MRGEFKPVATSAPGIRVREHLPRTARWMHRAAVARSVNHRAGCHNTLPTFNGYAEPNPNHPPSMGSVCKYLKKDPGGLPACVCLPTVLGYGDAGRPVPVAQGGSPVRDILAQVRLRYVAPSASSPAGAVVVTPADASRAGQSRGSSPGIPLLLSGKNEAADLDKSPSVAYR